MLNFSVSILPLAVLSVVNFFFSWIWYSPMLFAKPWAEALGLKLDGAMTEADKKRMPWLFASGLVASVLVVYVLMVLVNSLGARDPLSGALIGLLVWVGFALTHSLNTLWEGRKTIVLVINNGLFLLTYTGFGALLSVWK